MQAGGSVERAESAAPMATLVTAGRLTLATVSQPMDVSMAELTLLAGLLALLGLMVWLVDSDDDNGGGGLMQPALVPVRVRR